jgi:hypothetical protein
LADANFIARFDDSILDHLAVEKGAIAGAEVNELMGAVGEQAKFSVTARSFSIVQPDSAVSFTAQPDDGCVQLVAFAFIGACDHIQRSHAESCR